MIRVVGVDSPAVHLAEGNEHLTAEKLGILRAMRMAVAMAAPGDVILQDDMVPVEDDGPIETVPGQVTTLDQPSSRAHVCPRAFLIPDQETRAALIAAWSDETRTACYGWAAIPKVQGPVIYHHPRRDDARRTN